MFMGEFHYTIDEKGRLTIPARLRLSLGDNFIITKGLDGCLFIYPQNEWDKIINKYKEFPDTKAKRQFMRIFLSGAVICECDKQGRVKLPEPLLIYSNILKDCIIIGVDDRLEVWSKEKWEEFINSNEENLADMVDELFMGDENA